MRFAMCLKVAMFVEGNFFFFSLLCGYCFFFSLSFVFVSVFFICIDILRYTFTDYFFICVRWEEGPLPQG